MESEAMSVVLVAAGMILILSRRATRTGTDTLSEPARRDETARRWKPLVVVLLKRTKVLVHSGRTLLL